MNCLTIDDFKREGSRLLSALPTGENAEDCEQFRSDLQAINSLVETIFRNAAMLSRRADTIEDVAELWLQVVGVFDIIIGSLMDWRSKAPGCAGPSDFDTLLEFRKAAHDRLEIHS